MPVSQLQKARPQQWPQSSQKLQVQDGGPALVQAAIIDPKVPLDSDQPEAVLAVEQQSQKVVQDLINAAIGCITYLRYRHHFHYPTLSEKQTDKTNPRGLIPEKSFCDMSYGGTANAHQPQPQSGTVIQGSGKTGRKKESGTRVKQIRRGFSSEADTLLDLIERGIFDALGKGYLKAFQLAVFLDIERPDIIQEAYTFSVNYHKKDSGNSVGVKDITISTAIHNGTTCDQSTELLDLVQINRSVRALIRRLIVVTQNLDLLPENRYLTIRLYHTSDAPGNWTPPMFTQSTGKPLWFDNDVSSALSDEVFGTMETGLHTVQVRVTSGKRPFSEVRTEVSDPEDGAPNPPKRQCPGVPVGAHNFIEFAPAKDHPPRYGGGTCLSSQDSFSSEGRGITRRPVPIPTLAHGVTDGPPFETVTVGTAQTGQLYTQGTGGACSSDRDKMFQEESMSSSFELRKSASVVPSLRLGESKLEEMLKKARGVGQDGGWKRQSGGSQIRCECGGETENMDTIQCDSCDGWQHCECYGFVGNSDPRIGDMHMCYTCLLGENEPYLLREMKSFTIARRIVWCLMRSSLGKTCHDIMKTIGIESLQQSAVMGILSILVEQGYICIFNPRKIATKRSPNKYRIVETTGALKSVEENLLDPLVNISHHYEPPETPSKTNPRWESAQEKQGSETLRFGSPTNVDGSQEQVEETHEPAVAETPKSAIKTSDMENHLKAGNWS
ncbi:DNA binding protein [Orbilia javanica]|uniref:DNA binding protein n=1 Tax=Orbilia javanica TaxID=47235 RepID=A0AAN8MMG9_9PEZI